jgi:hypothetical protein
MAQSEERPLLGLRVIVSRRSHDGGIRPRFVYRQTPMGPSDSGWSALVGDESKTELDDPEALVSEEIAVLISRWPELRQVFESEAPGTQWRWDDDEHRYVPLTERR